MEDTTLNKSANPVNDQFWLQDPMVLIKNNNYYRIVPTSGMTSNQIYNSLTRLCLLIIILYAIFSKNRKYIYIPIIAIIVIIILYYMTKNNNATTWEPFEKTSNNNSTDTNTTDGLVQSCRMPTNNNPFMNITLADLMDEPDRPSACQKTNDGITNNDMANNLFKDPNDVFNRKSKQRQFYTMPVTINPNDQTSFAKWLYGAPETCKENQLNCLKYEDIRFNRSSSASDSRSDN